MGPSTYARVAEIMSGRANSQQGLAATCKDLACKEESEAWGGFWSGAWARRSDEGGVTPSEAIREVAPTSGNTRRGQRSPGHSVAKDRGAWEDMAGTARSNFPSDGNIRVDSAVLRLGGRQTTDARGGCEPALELPRPWAGPFSDKCRAEPRSEPDSGNPTVRDRREALRNVAMETGSSMPRAHATGQAPALLVCALNFYPDNRTYGLKGGWGTGSALRTPRP
jgi:hypothetical protein